MAKTPTEFLRAWCHENRITVATLLAEPRSKLRQQALVDMKVRFPNMSSTRAAVLFGLDHTTVIYAWRKAGVATRTRKPQIPLSATEIAVLRAMRNSGASWAEMTRYCGRSFNYVKSVFDKEFKNRIQERERNRRRRLQQDITEKRRVVRQEAERRSRLF